MGSLRKGKKNTMRWLARVTPGGFFGLLILATVFVLALFADVLAPHDPNEMSITQKLLPPAGSDRAVEGHFLGTDQLGRDLLSRLIHGSRPSLIIPFLATLIAMTLGGSLAMLAGLSRGKLDLLVMLLNDTVLSLPGLLIAIAMIGAIGRTEYWVLIVVLGVLGWVNYTRVLRSNVLTLRERAFVMASIAMGASTIHITLRQILPSVWSIMLVLAAVQMAGFTLVEAALSYLGLGLPPGTPSWGRMVAEGKQHMFVAWWYALFPGLAITIYVCGLFLFGDWLRTMSELRSKHFF